MIKIRSNVAIARGSTAFVPQAGSLDRMLTRIAKARCTGTVVVGIWKDAIIQQMRGQVSLILISDNPLKLC